MATLIECPRFGRFWAGCKWEPRYDLGASTLNTRAEGDGGTLLNLAEKYRPKTYVRDVCVKCGKVIERAKA